jgi:hypothetical protein
MRSAIKKEEDTPESDSAGKNALWNICTDLAINDALKGIIDLPSGSVLPEDVDLPPGAGAEDYYALLTDEFD